MATEPGQGTPTDALPVRLKRMYTPASVEYRRQHLTLSLRFNHYPDVYVIPVNYLQRLEIVTDIFTDIDPADMPSIAHLQRLNWRCDGSADPELVCTSPGSKVLARIPRTRIRSDKQLELAVVRLTWHLVDTAPAGVADGD